MRILVITSCTGQKSVKDERQLTLEDFQKGAEHVAARQSELSQVLTPAGTLYTGQQHKRLMRGVRQFRTTRSDQGDVIDLCIVSAGYGLVADDDLIAPYEATFSGMNKTDLHAWARSLELPNAFRSAVGEPYDLG